MSGDGPFWWRQMFGNTFIQDARVIDPRRVRIIGKSASIAIIDEFETITAKHYETQIVSPGPNRKARRSAAKGLR